MSPAPRPAPGAVRPALGLVSVAILTAALTGPPLGEEQFGNEAVPNNDEWPAGTLAVANDTQRVYRRWINGNEDFCFIGKAAALNAALTRFASIEGIEHRVLLFPTAGSTRSFEDIEVAFDWRLNAPSGIYKFVVEREFKGSLVHSDEPVFFVHFHEAGLKPEDVELPPGLRVLAQAEMTDWGLDALQDDRERVRAEGAAWLGAWVDEPSVAATLTELLADEQRSVRVAAAAALARAVVPAADLTERLRALAKSSEAAWERGRLESILQQLEQRKPAPEDAAARLRRRAAAVNALAAGARAPDQPPPADKH